MVVALSTCRAPPHVFAGLHTLLLLQSVPAAFRSKRVSVMSRVAKKPGFMLMAPPDWVAALSANVQLRMTGEQDAPRYTAPPVPALLDVNLLPSMFTRNS